MREYEEFMAFFSERVESEESHAWLAKNPKRNATLQKRGTLIRYERRPHGLVRISTRVAKMNGGTRLSSEL